MELGGEGVLHRLYPTFPRGAPVTFRQFDGRQIPRCVDHPKLRCEPIKRLSMKSPFLDAEIAIARLGGTCALNVNSS